MSGVQETAVRPVCVMSALAVMAIVNETVLPALRQSGLRADMIWDPTVALMQRIERGERADAIVAIDWALDDLASSGRIDPTSRRPVAQVSVGVAVRAGAPKPDISTTAQLRQALLDAPSLVYSRAGASGIYFEKLIDRLGIGDTVRAKSLVIPAGLTAERVASGEAELAIQQVSELMVVPGVDVVGPMPAELQATTNFGAAVFSDAVDPDGARRFIQELLGPEAHLAYARAGLVPLF